MTARARLEQQIKQTDLTRHQIFGVILLSFFFSSNIFYLERTANYISVNRKLLLQQKEINGLSVVSVLFFLQFICHCSFVGWHSLLNSFHSFHLPDARALMDSLLLKDPSSSSSSLSLSSSSSWGCILRNQQAQREVLKSIIHLQLVNLLSYIPSQVPTHLPILLKKLIRAFQTRCSYYKGGCLNLSSFERDLSIQRETTAATHHSVSQFIACSLCGSLPSNIYLLYERVGIVAINMRSSSSSRRAGILI